MAIDCLERGKAGERDGIVEAIESTEPEPLCLCRTGEEGLFLSCGEIDGTVNGLSSTMRREIQLQ